MNEKPNIIQRKYDPKLFTTQQIKNIVLKLTPKEFANASLYCKTPEVLKLVPLLPLYLLYRFLYFML